MPDLTQWLLVNVLSPLLLPLFLIGTLCLLAGVRPEPVIAAVLGILGDIIRFTFGLAGLILKALTASGRARK